jgi:probable HAF family extracellular repeat protein
VLSNGTLTQLPNPAGLGCGAAIAINNNGEVLGACGDGNSDSRAAVWVNGQPTDLGTLGGPQTSAAAINNLGQVVGFSQTSTDANHAFIWQNGKMTDLGPNFFPSAVNDHGVIVGGNEIYNGTLQNLQNLIPAGSPYQIQSANGINDNGQIIASAFDTTTDQTHALLLTPTG